MLELAGMLSCSCSHQHTTRESLLWPRTLLILCVCVCRCLPLAITNRFCNNELADWKRHLTPEELKPEVSKVQPIMVVYFEGKCACWLAGCGGGAAGC